MTGGYRLLLASAGASNLADVLRALAFAWLATLITRDPWAVSVVAFGGSLRGFCWRFRPGCWPTATTGGS